MTDLDSSKAFQNYRQPVSINEQDVIPVGKVDVESVWNGVDAYIGANFKCRRCGEVFTFSASEQKTWREDYGFSIHSYAVNCRECRAAERDVSALRIRLCTVLTKKVFQAEDFDELIDVTDMLITKGRSDLFGRRLKQKIFWAAKRATHPRKNEVMQLLKR